MRPLRRSSPAPPVRLVHLGLGSFFRAHQAWYTDRAPDAAEWGYAAFAGRSARLAETLAAQDGLYTLVTRAADGDQFEVVGSLSRAWAAGDAGEWLACLAAPDLGVVTITVTEAGYRRAADGGLDIGDPKVVADVAALHAGRPADVRTAPGRLVAGLQARRASGAGPLSLVPCDNLPGNGRVVERVLADLTDLVDPSLRRWTAESVSFATTVVDRITPDTETADVRLVAATTGWEDRAPVVTEPFSEWVLQGAFPGGRPLWEAAGALVTDDLAPFERRKLWLLNGGHSLLAYAGSSRGATTVAEAVADPVLLGWLEQWWAEAAGQLGLPAPVVADYQAALLDRFANPRIRHRLDQIAADGSQKLPVRILPVLRSERAAGRVPEGAARVLAAWVCHVRGSGAPVVDVLAGALVPLAGGPVRESTRRLLEVLDAEVAADDAVVDAVVNLAGAG